MTTKPHFAVLMARKQENPLIDILSCHHQNLKILFPFRNDFYRFSFTLELILKPHGYFLPCSPIITRIFPND